MAVQRAISVTALTRYMKRVVEGDRHLRNLWLRGEISNFKRHSRGHMYMTIKDAGSRISAVMFAQDNKSLTFTPEEGMKVLVRGEVSLYEPYGQYQFYIKEMQQDGIGNLYLQFEALKKKLEQEGLFNPENKKTLPAMPKEIGVITSPTGAAVRDLFTTIKRRMPSARITLFPVLVQGEYAAASIARAIRQANEMNIVDVLIVGRGGGSIEELWAFNEEIVAREIFASQLPIISAVGHETDFTIADFVADLRAATPTAAGELVVPNIMDLEERIESRTKRLSTAMKRRIDRENDKLNVLRNSYAFKQPKALIMRREQDLDRLIDRAQSNAKRLVRDRWQTYEHLQQLLFKHHPDAMIQQTQKDIKNTSDRLKRAMRVLYERKAKMLPPFIAQLNALSPLNVMERGYALPYKEGALLKSVRQVAAGDGITVKLKDGTMDCQVLGIEEVKENG
ncbi:MAG: exodeoxyribonuclease VII large subunit [Tuberibacillus sp.]